MITNYNEFIIEKSSDYTIKDPEYWGITDYTWVNGVIDCHQDVKLDRKRIEKLPFKFGKIEGYFDCSINHLKTLVGAPSETTGSFNCETNKLKSLKGSPKKVGKDFACSQNYRLLDLRYCPKEVGGTFRCLDNNHLSSDIENYPLCIIKKHILDEDDIFSIVQKIVKSNQELFIPLLDDKVRFHQQVMRLDPSLIKHYKTIPPPLKRTILYNL